MEFFRIHRTIPFMRHAVVLNLISLITFLAAVFFIVTRGFHLSVEFTGGTVMEVSYPQTVQVEEVRNVVQSLSYTDFQVQHFGTSRDIMIRLPVREGQTSATQSQTVLDALKAKQPDVELRRVEFVGPQVGEELVHNGLMALLFVVVGIMIYLGFRFEWKFAVAGVLANLHDVVIILGFFAFFQWEFSLAVLAGVLAVLGYSVNESVVIMDRIRENFRKQRKAEVREVIDSAITQTISRTIITHGSTQMMVLSMFFFGGPTLHYFSLALTIGIWFGIYSSVFVAAAIAMWRQARRPGQAGHQEGRRGQHRSRTGLIPPQASIHGMPARLRRVLHRAVHFLAHAGHAPRQARRPALCAPDSRPAMRPVRQAGTARGLRQPATRRRHVRHDARIRHPLAEPPGTADSTMTSPGKLSGTTQSRQAGRLRVYPTGDNCA